MTLAAISAQAKQVLAQRNAESLATVELSRLIAAFCDESHGNAKALAVASGISTQHICDIRHGRRKAGNDTLERIGGLSLTHDDTK